MKKRYFLLLFSILPIFAQENIQLIRSKFLTGHKLEDGTTLQKVFYGLFKHEGMEMEADSTYFYPAIKKYTAFGNIKIRQGDSIKITSDKLDYDGNIKKADLLGNVILIKNNNRLYTEKLDYYSEKQIGIYKNGGKLFIDQDTLTSKKGEYFSSQEKVIFFDNVLVRSKDSKTYCDTLLYYTEEKNYFFSGNSKLITSNEKDTLFSTFGQYNSKTKKGKLLKENSYYSYPNVLKAEILDIDREKEVYKGYGNVFFKDRTKELIIKGHDALFNKEKDEIIVTKGAHIIFLSDNKEEGDSIFIKADTIYSKKILQLKIKKINSDTFLLPHEKKQHAEHVEEEHDEFEQIRTPSNNETETASLLTSTIETDTFSQQIGLKEETHSSTLSPKVEHVQVSTQTMIFTQTMNTANSTATSRVINMFRHVKLFKKDFQLIADSLFYTDLDSIIRVYTRPISWSENTQLVGDTGFVKLKADNKIDRLKLIHDIFGVNENKKKELNQLKGRELTATFKNDTIHRAVIDGNSETLYHVWDSLTYIGINRSISSMIDVRFVEGEMNEFYFLDQPELKLYPPHKIEEGLARLRGFVWSPELKPKDKLEIIKEFLELQNTFVFGKKEYARREKEIYNRSFVETPEE